MHKNTLPDRTNNDLEQIFIYARSSLKQFHPPNPNQN